MSNPGPSPVRGIRAFTHRVGTQKAEPKLEDKDKSFRGACRDLGVLGFRVNCGHNSHQYSKPQKVGNRIKDK